MSVESDHEEINLNEEQEYVVKYEGDKFLSVQAGPGSGKTRVLVEKVKYMVKEKENPEDPESFLIITFTEKAAEELRDRLIDGDIDASDVQKMHISTIHSFCLKLLETTGTVGLDVVAEGDKFNLFIKKHLKDLEFGDELNIGNNDIKNIIEKYNEYSTFKVKDKAKKLAEYLEDKFPVDPEFIEFVQSYMEENDGEYPVDEVKDNEVFKESLKNAKYIQIAKSYELYLDLLKRENAVDFNQMQFKALEKMNEGYMPAYTNILIDEFQDTDPVQMEIFKKLIEHPNTNSLTVVGDLNQSIYGFRGSNKNYFKELIELYPDKFIEIRLSTNYRSTEEIIDLTQDFILPHYDSQENLKLAECGSGKHNDVYYMVSENGKKEAENILEIIKYIQADERMNLSDIGILSRSVRPSASSCFRSLLELLEENDINYQIVGIGDLEKNEELKYILTLMYHLIQDDDPYYTFVPRDTDDWLNLRTLTGANENKVLFELSEDTKEKLNKVWADFEDEVINADGEVCDESPRSWRQIDEYGKIFKNKPQERQKGVFSRVKKPILSDENLIDYGITDERDLEFFHALNDLKRRVNAEKYFDRPLISDVYYELLCDITGYLTEDLVNNEEEIVNNLAAIIPSMSIYGEVMSERSLRGAFWFIKRSLGSLDAYKPDEDAVQIMTVHRSKGKEFPVVILASLRDPVHPRDKAFPWVFKESDKESVTYTPDEFLEYPRYEGTAEESYIQEEERVIYVGKTRAEDELIISSIVKESSADLEKALDDSSLENILALNKGPKRINDVIEDNLDFSESYHTKLINPEAIDINLLEPRHKPPKEELVPLSFTALENYNECPFKYKLLDKLGFSFSSKKEIDDGIFIHSALERINKKIKAKYLEEDLSTAEIYDKHIGDDGVAKEVETLFEKANIRFKEEDPENYDKKLKTITKDVIRYYKEVGNDLTIINSEYPFYIRGSNYAFSGVVDLIYEKDGKLGILDYKNTSLVGEEYLRKYRKQLHFYLMALRDEKKEFEGHKIEEIQIYALKIKDKEKINPLISFDIDEEYIEELKEELERTAEKIKNNEFEANCDDCGDCQFRKICKK